MSRRPSGGDDSALEWIKSSYSSNEHGSDCVEVAATRDTVNVRDSKDPSGPQLAFTPDAWDAFVAYASRL